MRRHIRYRRSKLIRPTNESTYLNILPSPIRQDPRCDSSSSRERTPRSSSLPRPKFYLSSTPAHLHLAWASIPIPLPPPRAFSIFLCLTILIFHNPSCLNIHDGLREHARTGMSVGPDAHTMGPDCGLGIRRQSPEREVGRGLTNK